MQVKTIAKNLGGEISKNSPTILTGLAVTGLVTTVIFAVKATPKALELIEERKGEVTYEYKLTKREIIGCAWKCYIPTGAIAVATIGCIIGANSINLRRNAALASVYTLTETAFKEYQAKVTETIGKNKELKVRDEIAADRIKENPPSSNEVIFTGKGDVLCLDSLSGRYFKSDIEQIRKVVNELNRDLLSSMFINLNELYYAFGLPALYPLGENLGWDVERSLLEISFSTQLTPKDEPCIVLNYNVSPKFI